MAKEYLIKTISTINYSNPLMRVKDTGANAANVTIAALQERKFEVERAPMWHDAGVLWGVTIFGHEQGADTPKNVSIRINAASNMGSSPVRVTKWRLSSAG